MTGTDFKLRVAIETARRNNAPYRSIEPKLENGKIVGFIINGIITIE